MVYASPTSFVDCCGTVQPAVANLLVLRGGSEPVVHEIEPLPAADHAPAGQDEPPIQGSSYETPVWKAGCLNPVVLEKIVHRQLAKVKM